ncbi:uncharacterized protein PgNI_08401 [Pyricularia grisea]|uniref:Uncharacterized protein n=1 Tax=Pyricularia grisea TaxID=148305 RepID=A0A6P8AVB2_PYRGI|nr:uncharacterized protein PgNI_08401 [Pyricularia grisea]TLD06130.1 hypothetical protein PgNI_08401 [Pyricularia grisea]
MIVGHDFMEQVPGVLWDHQPPGKKVLLAIQPRMKRRHRQLCLECRLLQRWVVKRLHKNCSGETKETFGRTVTGKGKWNFS